MLQMRLWLQAELQKIKTMISKRNEYLKKTTLGKNSDIQKAYDQFMTQTLISQTLWQFKQNLTFFLPSQTTKVYSYVFKHPNNSNEISIDFKQTKLIWNIGDMWNTWTTIYYISLHTNINY